jgi:hypothetical protein
MFRHSKSTVHGSAITHNFGGSLHVDRCRFYSNETTRANNGFGPLVCNSSGVLTQKATILNSEFAYNVAPDAFAGMWVVGPHSNQNVLVANNCIYSNFCAGASVGTSISAVGFQGGYVLNNVIYGNRLAAGAVPTRAVVKLWSPAIFANNIIYGNEGHDIVIDDVSALAVDYNLVQGGHAGTGNIDTNPLFVAADSGDFHLQPNSPAIDAGDTGVVAAAGLLVDKAGSKPGPGSFGRHGRV